MNIQPQRKLSPPLNLNKWIADNRHLLKPPVGNRCIWEDGDFMVFISAGPNGRTDFHLNGGEEFFYQIEGDIFLKLWVDDQFKDQWIREGEIFLLPAGTPHSPQRPPGTVGLVIERKRLEGEMDGLMWRCPKCTTKMYEEYFHLTNIVTQFKPVFDRFFGTPELCTCKKCGNVLTKESNFFDV
jgi:3-hydroxyanthranilate 3,4-dioxygenase